MENLIKDVSELVDAEYNRASQQYGRFHSGDHESIAVLAEEAEEANEEMQKVMEHLEQFWELVKQDAADQNKQILLKHIYTDAVLVACEAIQVAAMAFKGVATIKNRRS